VPEGLKINPSGTFCNDQLITMAHQHESAIALMRLFLWTYAFETDPLAVEATGRRISCGMKY